MSDAPLPFPPGSLAARLFAEGYRFDFFQAVRLLERVQPRRRCVGQEGPPDLEVVRFAAVPGVSFPPAAIDAVDWTSDGPPRMTINFFGLTGPSGIAPAYFTRAVMALRRVADQPERGALAAWLDLFTHRLTSLFYRAWARYRLPRMSIAPA